MPKNKRKIAKRTTERRKVEYTNHWWCNTCKIEAPMTHLEAVNHLRVFHKLGDKIPATRNLILHLDGSDYFSSQYEVIVTGPKGERIVLQNSVTSPRRKDDMMRYV